MTKTELFCFLFREASLYLHPPLDQFLNSVSYIQLNSSRLTNYLETTDIPITTTLNECLGFFYQGKPKARILEMNGL